MDFRCIQKLKKNPLLLGDDGINYARVMAAKLYPNSNIYTFKCFLLAIFFEPAIYYIKKESDILVSSNLEHKKRKDYFYISSKIKSYLHSSQLFFHRKLKLHYVFYNILGLFILLKKNRYLVKSSLDILRISSLELYYKKIPPKLDNIQFEKIKIYISFCDSYLEENLITQYFKGKEVITSTLQHGQYKYIKKGEENTESEAYLNFISDFIFVWGKATEKEFIKAGINRNRIIRVGALKEFTNRKAYRVASSKKKFLIIMNGETNSKSNCEMIKIANVISRKYQLFYDIRLHPDNKLYKYLKLTNENFLGTYKNKKNCMTDYMFSIIHMTGVFVEILSANLPFFLYDNKFTADIFKHKLITFGTIKEFDKKYYYMLNNEDIFLDELNSLYSHFNIANNDLHLRNNYIQAINAIKKGEV